LPKENVQIEIERGSLVLAATSAKEGLGFKPGKRYFEALGVWDPRYVGEGVRIEARCPRVNGIEATFSPTFKESYGEGNVQIRAVTDRFCYMVGINFRYDERNNLENSDVFVHLWSNELNSYPDVGRLHLKDIFPNAAKTALGMKWGKDFYYGIGRTYRRFLIPSNFSKTRDLVREDSLAIYENGVNFWDLKIDLFGKRGPSKIKAHISDVRIREI
jgi:hypothetical protein